MSSAHAMLILETLNFINPPQDIRFLSSTSLGNLMLRSTFKRQKSQWNGNRHVMNSSLTLFIFPSLSVFGKCYKKLKSCKTKVSSCRGEILAHFTVLGVFIWLPLITSTLNPIPLYSTWWIVMLRMYVLKEVYWSVVYIVFITSSYWKIISGHPRNAHHITFITLYSKHRPKEKKLS